jgi:hypothetical protein
MNTGPDDSELAAVYAESVERERQAWQALQSFPPGSIGRAQAWEVWSRAITFTNQAWRRLSADRITHGSRHDAAGHHAGA